MIPRILALCMLTTLTLGAHKRSLDLDEVISQVFDEDPSGKEHDPMIQYRVTPRADSDCKCVPYYLCPNGTVLTDGTGLLDIRGKEGACENYMDSCCQNPLDETNPIKPERKPRQGCGQRHPDGIGFRITGDSNNEAQFGEFPWMTAVLKKTPLDDGSELMVYQCGGALIHARVVLTAAHCAVQDEDDGVELIARVGEWDTQTKTEIYPHQNAKVAKVITHPGFKTKNLHNDIAILLLENAVELGENVDTICLPTEGLVPQSTNCFATGWGKDKFGEKGQYQVILKKIDLPIVPKDVCVDLLRKTRLGAFFKLDDSFLCAGGIIGKDTCKGDGGSPLVCPIQGKPGFYELTGLVSWGIGCGDETPGVYADVSQAVSWITQELRILGIQL